MSAGLLPMLSFLPFSLAHSFIHLGFRLYLFFTAMHRACGAIQTFQLTFIVLSAGRRRGLRFGLSLLSAFVYSLVRCSSSVGCCFALITSPLSTCPQLSFFKRTDWRLALALHHYMLDPNPLALGMHRAARPMSRSSTSSTVDVQGLLLVCFSPMHPLSSSVAELGFKPPLMPRQ